MNFLALILPALIPVFTDGVRSVIAKITGIGGAEPKTVDEAIRLTDSQTKRLQALSSLDNPGGEVSKWVANFRAMHRYVLADMILVATFVYVFLPTKNMEIANFLLNLSASVFGFFFGDRVYLHLKERK
jgi:hypothetical protein